MDSPETSLPMTLSPGSTSKADELVDDALAARLEVLEVGGRPPVLQVPLQVELRALVVEAVRDLVADDRADGAVVDGVVGLGVEEGRLEDAGREDDLVRGASCSRR